MNTTNVTDGEHAAFWARLLDGDLPRSTFPADYDRPPVQSFVRAQETVGLSHEAISAARHLADEQGASVFVVFLAAVALVLSRYADSEELLVGSVAAPGHGADGSRDTGTPHEVVLRFDLSGDPNVTDCLRSIGQVVTAVAEHAPCSYRDVVPGLDGPPFRVLCHATGVESDFVAAPAQAAAQSVLESAAMDADVCVTLVVTDDATWHLTLDYDSELYRAETVERVAAHVARAFEAMATGATAPVSRLDFIRHDERERVLHAWNDTTRDYPLDRCLPELLDAQIQRTPKAPAVTFEGATISYEELGVRADAVANMLRARGVGPESLIGIAMERSTELVVALCGVVKAGAAYVPLDPSYPPERISMMVEDARLQLVLTHAPVTMALPLHVETIAIDDPDAPSLAVDHAETALPPVAPTNAAYVIFTSGSTGRPKGVVNTHAGICNRLWWMQDAYELKADDVVLQKTPFSFDVSVWEFFWPLMVGARLVLARPDGHRDSAYLRRLIQSEAVTILHFVPSMLRLFLEERDLRETCGSLRHVIASGEALAHDLQEQFFDKLDAQLHNLYGPTEAAVDVTSWACRRGGDRSVVPIGRPIANTQLFVLDRYQRPVPPGVPGELYIGGVQVARGYVNRPDLTAERFIESPLAGDPAARLYRTGDRVRCWDDGTIEYLGRMDDQVKIRGFRIELGEIEAVLASAGGVHQAVVVVRPGPAGDDQLVAYVVPERNAALAADGLRQHLSARLAPYMVPTHFAFMDALPLLPNGKVNRKELPAPTPRRRELDENYVETRTATEKTIAGVWCEYLRIEKVGVNDNFFELGGDSLLSMRVATALQDALATPVAVLNIFEAPTVRKLAAHLDRGQGRQLEVDDIQRRAERQRRRFARPRPTDRS